LLGGLWNFSFPINKKLWTSSFVLFAAGWSLLLLAAAIWIVDVRRGNETSAGLAKPPGFPTALLLVFGTNAITAYVFSELVAAAISNIHLRTGVNLQQWIYGTILSAVPNPAVASLLYSLAFVAACWLAVYPLYRRKIFIKI
jgi:predicted acyltransferase